MINVGRHMLTTAFVFVSLVGIGTANAANFPDGKTLYEKNCAVCHGNNGDISEYGKHLKPFPARNLRAIAQWLDVDEFRRIITYGLHNSKMTPKKNILSPLEIEAVTQYIKTFRFTSNPSMGKKRYIQVCAICHGKDGRARTGLGAKNLVYSKLNMDALIHTIRVGRPGTMMTPKFNQISNTDIVNIATYVYSLRYKANEPRGATLYKKNCISCHATPSRIHLAGRGAFQPSIRDIDNTQLELRIRHGLHVNRAGKHIALLKADDIQDIIAYIRRWKPET